MGPKAVVPPGVVSSFDEHYDEASTTSKSDIDSMKAKKFKSEKDITTIDPTYNLIRIIVNDFGDQCSLHGIYALFSKRSLFAKFLWLIAILFMNGLFVYYFIDLLEDAVLKDPPATTTSLSYEQVK